MSSKQAAIVTGASSGIGLATARALGRKGYALVLAARGAERLAAAARRCQADGATAVTFPTDVADRRQVKALVATAVERFGRLDVMVNNAGYGLLGPVWDMDITDEDMRAVFNVNYFGVFYGCKAAAAVMIRQRSGHIFNVSSVIGKRGTPLHGAYCATKFAVCGLTDALRVELRPYDVRVTCVCPGLTQTKFFQQSRLARRAESAFGRYTRRMPADAVGRKIAATVGKDTPELVF